MRFLNKSFLAGLILVTVANWPACGSLLVSNNMGSNILEFEATTGSFARVFAAPLFAAQNLAQGPGGDIFATAGSVDGVVRFDRSTGANLGLFAAAYGVNGDLIFGPDGNLYVASPFNHAVVRFDGSNGRFLDLFASGGGLESDAPSGIAFGPSGTSSCRVSSTMSF